MFIVWLPSKLLAYLAPFIGAIWFIIRSRSGRGFIRTMFFVLGYSVLICAYWLWGKYANEPFIIQNSILSFITYGSFLFFLVIPNKINIADTPQSRYINVIKYVLIIESALGIFQAVAYVFINGGNFDFSTGDVVQGTLSPFSFLNPEGNFNNQIYTYNLLVLLLFYIPHVVNTRKGGAVAILAFSAILFASVMHLLISFIIAIAIITIYYSGSFIKVSGYKLIIVIIIFLSIGLSMFLQPKNFELIGYYFNKITTNDSPKTKATITSVTEFWNNAPKVNFVGLGPGQYCSRAGLIGTGHYFGSFMKPKEVPLLSNQMSEPFKKHIYPLWQEVSTNPAKYGNSTMARPFYSILSILIEFGYIAFFVILIILGAALMKMKGLYLTNVKLKNTLNSFNILACASLIVFYFLVSFFENYLELTQAVFPGLLLYKYYHSSFRVLN